MEASVTWVKKIMLVQLNFNTDLDQGDDTCGSLIRLNEKNWFKTALNHYNTGQCMDLFRVYCIGWQFMTEDCTVMISSSNAWNLLNFWRSVSSCYYTQIVMEVTHKCSTAVDNKHCIRFNMVGSKAAQLSFKLNPRQYILRPTTPCWGLWALFQLWRHVTANVLSYLNVKCMLHCQHYATGKHELPRSHCLSDNSSVFQNFMKSVLGIKAELCQTHTTTIASNNGTHRKYFEDD